MIKEIIFDEIGIFMNINCFYPQKKLASPYLDAVKEYEKRLQRYCKLKLISGTNRNFQDQSMLIYICSGASGIAMLSSEEFASFINQQGLSGKHELSFVLTDQPPEHTKSYSISSAPLKDDLLTVLFTEQLYRAFRIIHNHSYHK